MTAPEVAEFYGVPIKTLHHWRYEKKGPRAFKVGRHLRYRSTDVVSWLEEQAA